MSEYTNLERADGGGGGGGCCAAAAAVGDRTANKLGGCADAWDDVDGALGLVH